MKKTIAIILTLVLALAFVACGTKAANLQESYYYKVAFNNMAGEYMGVNLTNELIRTESETIALYDNGTFVVTFASSLVGTISGDEHEAGFVYQQQMYEQAVLTGTYTITASDDLMHSKTIQLDSYTAFTHNNVNESLTEANEDGITFTASTGKQLTVDTETGLLSEFFEFYDGQYNAVNTSFDY